MIRQSPGRRGSSLWQHWTARRLLGVETIRVDPEMDQEPTKGEAASRLKNLIAWAISYCRFRFAKLENQQAIEPAGDLQNTDCQLNPEIGRLGLADPYCRRPAEEHSLQEQVDRRT